jgi:hypothetical protein|tara:strand:- start:912 stop:1184 length:273 start_codon:yes stop_codon:yes gene_type:complete
MRVEEKLYRYLDTLFTIVDDKYGIPSEVKVRDVEDIFSLTYSVHRNQLKVYVKKYIQKELGVVDNDKAEEMSKKYVQMKYDLMADYVRNM